jgi:ArsR family transcriptional regulator
MRHTEEQAYRASQFLKALANPYRLMVLCLINGRELSVGELEQHLGLRQPTLSQQLARLREEGLVETRRDGKQIYYRLASEEVRRTIALLDELFCASPDARTSASDARTPGRAEPVL